jgi:hypothetical protein
MASPIRTLSLHHCFAQTLDPLLAECGVPYAPSPRRDFSFSLPAAFLRSHGNVHLFPGGKFHVRPAATLRST